MAVSFDPDWNYDLENPLDTRHSKPFVNAQGQNQGTCVHLGNCDIGCDVHAKNTLDLNYIATAEKHGAEVRPLHVVRGLEPHGSGYRVTFDRIEGDTVVRGSEDAQKIVLAAGSVGSTELLLRCRDEHRTLPQISRMLGCDWSPNANVLTPDVYRSSDVVRQSVGPTISACLDFSDGQTSGGNRFILEDDGFPNLLLNAARAKLGSEPFSLLGWALHSHLRRSLNEANPLASVAVWLGAGVDAGDGHLKLGRSWLALAARLRLSWSVKRSRGMIERFRGAAVSPPTAAHCAFRCTGRCPVAAHGASARRLQNGHANTNGVVDHRRIAWLSRTLCRDGSVLPRQSVGILP